MKEKELIKKAQSAMDVLNPDNKTATDKEKTDAYIFIRGLLGQLFFADM